MSSPADFAEDAAESAAEDAAESAAEGGVGIPMPSGDGGLIQALLATDGGIGVETLTEHGLPEGAAHVLHGISMMLSELVGFDASQLDGMPALGHVAIGVYKTARAGSDDDGDGETATGTEGETEAWER